MAKIRWACPECEIETSYKGLCRECTEYDGEGVPVKPIHRVRLNWAKTDTPNMGKPKSKQDFLQSRQRKPTKKQFEALKEHINSHSKNVAHEHTDECGDDCAPDSFQEIGEMIVRDEEE